VVASEPLSPRTVRAQLDAIFVDFTPAAIKSGMLANRAVVDALAETLERNRVEFYVCDPVLFSKNEFALLDADGVEALLTRLMPRVDVLTPNVPEAARLSGLPIRTMDDCAAAAARLLERGAGAIVIKGGHLDEEAATDLLFTSGGEERFTGERLRVRHSHGTGCVFSAALATQLARGLGLSAAVAAAKQHVTGALRHGLALGSGIGPVDTTYRWQSAIAGEGVS